METGGSACSRFRAKDCARKYVSTDPFVAWMEPSGIRVLAGQWGNDFVHDPKAALRLNLVSSTPS